MKDKAQHYAIMRKDGAYLATGFSAMFYVTVEDEKQTMTAYKLGCDFLKADPSDSMVMTFKRKSFANAIASILNEDAKDNKSDVRVRVVDIDCTSKKEESK